MRVKLIALLILMLGGAVHAQTYTATCPGAMPSRLVIGQQAIIMANGGSNLRERPSANALLLDIIPPNERITIVEGPFCAEGYAWWQTDHAGLRGWLAEGGGDVYWLEPFTVQAAQVGSIRVEALPQLGITLLGERSEFFTAFTLNQYPVAAQFHPARLYVYMPPPEGEEISTTIRAIQRRDAQLLEIPTLAQAQFLPLQQGNGLRFLSVFFDPAARARPAYVLYSFRGFTDAGAFISMNVAVNPPADTLDFTQPVSNLPRFERNTQEILNSIAPDAFSPPLTLLDALVQSLNTQADIERSDRIRYQYGDSLTLHYHPLLAWQISEQVITEETDTPHLDLSFTGYPVQGEAHLRIYRTSDLQGDDLVSLQLLLSRQRNNPPHIPAPATDGEHILNPQDVIYLNFSSGSGVRYLVDTENGEQFAGFQGLSSDQAYLVSASFALSGNPAELYPPLQWLDELLQSIDLSTP